MHRCVLRSLSTLLLGVLHHRSHEGHVSLLRHANLGRGSQNRQKEEKKIVSKQVRHYLVLNGGLLGSDLLRDAIPNGIQ